MKKVRVKAEKTEQLGFARVLLELGKAALGGIVRAVVSFILERH
ncbi:hypothetical protein [Hymenobacter sediminis]|nr:hypothetical protein [Hymenobacter sediminis]